MAMRSTVVLCSRVAAADLTGQFDTSLTGSTFWGFILCGITAAALLLWYRVYRLPFTMFLLGLTGIAFVAIATKSLVPVTLGAQFTDLFDLRSGYNLALGTLIFGIVAFIAGVFVVRGLLDFVTRHGFTPFAWWRIAVGTAGLIGLWLVG